MKHYNWQFLVFHTNQAAAGSRGTIDNAQLCSSCTDSCSFVLCRETRRPVRTQLTIGGAARIKAAASSEKAWGERKQRLTGQPWRLQQMPWGGLREALDLSNSRSDPMWRMSFGRRCSSIKFFEIYNETKIKAHIVFSRLFKGQ